MLPYLARLTARLAVWKAAARLASRERTSWTAVCSTTSPPSNRESLGRPNPHIPDCDDSYL